MSLIKGGNDSGGRDAINRLIKAYNFSSRQQLCEHLKVSKSTMVNILKNDNDVTIRPLSKIVAPSIKYTELRNGELQSYDEILLDSRLVEGDSSNYLFIQTTTESFIVDVSVKQISNGSWLVDIDGVKSIVKVARIPGNKLVVHQEETTFECAVDDVDVVGRVVKVIKSI